MNGLAFAASVAILRLVPLRQKTLRRYSSLETLRERQDDAQARRDCPRARPPTMQARDRLHKAQAEPRAGLGAALLQPHEALQDALAILRRDARPAVGHGDRHRRPPRALKPMAIAGSDGVRAGLHGLGRILDRVVDEVGDRLAHELPVGVELRALRRRRA